MLDPDHLPDQPLVGRLGDVHLGHQAAVAEHDHLVGGLSDLLKAVADEDHRAARGRVLPGDPDHRGGLGRAERGGGLVEDQQPRVAAERLRHLEHLPGRDRQRGHRRPGIDVEPDRRDHPPGGGGGRLPVVEEPPRVLRPVAKGQVLGHVELPHQGELLGDHRHPGRLAGDRRAGRKQLAADRHLAAGIRGHRARQDAEQGRLPGPVLADQADDLPEREDQVLDLQHGGESVRLRHVVQGNAVGVALHPVLDRRICHWAEIPMLLQKLAKSLSFAFVMMPTPVLRVLPGPGTKYGLTRASVALLPRALSAAST